MIIEKKELIRIPYSKFSGYHCSLREVSFEIPGTALIDKSFPQEI